MNQNIVILAGRTVDFSVLSNQQQHAVANFVDNLTREKRLNQPMQKNSLYLAELFEMVKIDLSKDDKFDRDEVLSTKKTPKFGSAKGKIIIADDFDEPLTDFTDYMPNQG